jgi:EamA domain-containing membrane protein RarD
MTTGHLYMLCALLSFSALGVCHKLADVRQCRPSSITATLYCSSLLYLLLYLTAIKGVAPTAPGGVIWLAIPFGISASIAILAFQAGIRHGSIATSWLAINLSAGIPTVASILVYSENVSPTKAFALILIPIAMFLLWRDKKSEAARSAGE